MYESEREATKESTQSFYGAALPWCFTASRATEALNLAHSRLLIVDSASGLGGTWASERLYPNLRGQNSNGLYEYSDLPLSSVAPVDGTKPIDDQFASGLTINRYLHVWSEKWDLLQRMRFNWKVSPS